MTICARCRHAEFRDHQDPVCLAPVMQRQKVEHPVYGHECYRETDGGSVYYFDVPTPLCRTANLLGQCPAFEEKPAA